MNRARPQAPKYGKFTRGSLAQKLFEADLYSEKQADGSIFYDVLDCDVGGIDEDMLRRKYEAFKKYGDVVLEGEADDDELRKAIMEENAAVALPLDERSKVIS